MTLNPLLKSTLIGMGIGAAIGTLPGIFSGLVGSLVVFVRADIGIQNTSSFLIYLGIIIGGAAGAVVGAVAADGAGSDVDGVPMAEEAKR